MRAQVIRSEVVLDTRVPSHPGVYGAMSFPTEKGDLEPFLLGSESNVLKQLTPDQTIKPGYNIGYYSALAFLEKSNKLWFSRPISNGKYGGCFFSQMLPYTSLEITASSTTSTLAFKTNTDANLAKAETMYSFLKTGDKVRLSTAVGGTLPAPLAAATDYYIIKFDADTYRFQLASSLINAQDGRYITLTDNGTGTFSTVFSISTVNSEVEYGMSNPLSYTFSSDNGHPAGIQSTATVDVTGDSFAVSQYFYATAVTGDIVNLTTSGAFPEVETGDDLDNVTDYYIIKLEETGRYKIQLARTLSDAELGSYIPISTVGSGCTVTFKSKTVTDATVTCDHTTDTFTVATSFFNALVTNDKVRFSATGTFPTVDSGDAIAAGVDYYVIKTSTKIQLSRTSSGTAITFSGSGTGPFTLTVQNKLATSDLTGDISSDSLTISSTLYEVLSTKSPVILTTTDTLPEGLEEDTTYYVIKTSTENIIKLASSSPNAELGVAIDVKDAGTGIHTVHDKSNNELVGLEEKCLLFYNINPTSENVYVKLLSHPYGDEDTWTADQETAADTIRNPGCFIVYIYKKDKDSNFYEVENWTCSRDPNKKNNYGTSLFVETVLKGSEYIRAFSNPSVDDSIQPENQSDYLKLAKNYSGDTVSDTEMITAISKLSNTRKYACTVFMDAGWTTPAYQIQGILNTVEKRADCFGVFSTPVDYELQTNYLNQLLLYRNRELNVDTSWAALYTPHLKIQDKFNNRQILVSPDGYAGAAFSETASNYEFWVPVANQRGKINALGVSREFTDTDQDELTRNFINPIAFIEGKGIKIWGQYTLVTSQGPLDRLNVRGLLIYIEPAISEFVEKFLFSLAGGPLDNGTTTQTLIKSGVESYMTDILGRQGVYGFNVVCDSTINTPQVIDSNKLLLDLYVEPSKSVELIGFRTIITPTGASTSVRI